MSIQTRPGAALAKIIDTDGAERRREARYPTQDPAELQIVPGPSESIYGTVIDVSRSGLRISVRQRIGRGEQVMVKLLRNVIFGEVRYCRAFPDGFYIGLLIKHLVTPPDKQDKHVAEDPLSLYAVGKGLSVAEVIEVREHLSQCEACRARLLQKGEVLNPGGYHRGRLHLRPR